MLSSPNIVIVEKAYAVYRCPRQFDQPPPNGTGTSAATIDAGWVAAYAALASSFDRDSQVVMLQHKSSCQSLFS